jgi:zinc-ribbon domain
VTERHCRNCGHELAETDRFCPNCGTPVHEAAHVPTPEADVDVPSPPPQAGVTTPPPGEAGREGAQRAILVAPRPRWAQIGVAVLLAGLITEIPQLIWGLATWVDFSSPQFPSPQFVFGILHPLTLLCGLWAGLAWPGRNPKGLAVLGSLAGLLDLVVNWSIAGIMRTWWAEVWYITPLDFLSSIGIAVLFTAGGLFGDLIESWRVPRRREEESEVVREIAQTASGPRRQPSETTLRLVQALGPSLLALIGLIIAVITHQQ